MSSVFAEGLVLSLSDPELGSIVLKKPNPDPNTGGGLGGLSLGEFTYNGESLQMHLWRGDHIWDWSPRIRARKGYVQEYQMDVRVFDQDGTFVSSSGGDVDHLPKYDYPYDRFSSARGFHYS